jgi:hypothetical protein
MAPGRLSLDSTLDVPLGCLLLKHWLRESTPHYLYFTWGQAGR